MTPNPSFQRTAFAAAADTVTDNRYPLSLSAKIVSQMLGDGGLSGSTRGNVTDANHQSRDPDFPQQTFLIKKPAGF